MSQTAHNALGASCLDLLYGKRVVFWDFDGVIKESVEVKTAGFVHLFQSYGQEVAERVRRHHEAHGGMSRYEKVPLYLEWAGELVSADQIQTFCNQFSQLVQQAVIDSPWVPGVREYLLGHHTRQYFVLVTATPQAEIQQILEGLDLASCFREVHGAPTPKTTAIRDVLDHLKCLSGNALMVGDSDSDLHAAENNGVPFLLRRTAFNQALQNRYHGPRFDNLQL